MNVSSVLNLVRKTVTAAVVTVIAATALSSATAVTSATAGQHRSDVAQATKEWKAPSAKDVTLATKEWKIVGSLTKEW